MPSEISGVPQNFQKFEISEANTPKIRSEPSYEGVKQFEEKSNKIESEEKNEDKIEEKVELEEIKSENSEGSRV